MFYKNLGKIKILRFDFSEKGKLGDLTHSPSTRQTSQVLTNALFTSAYKAGRVFLPISTADD
jgi:hypothetical protein